MEALRLENTRLKVENHKLQTKNEKRPLFQQNSSSSVSSSVSSSPPVVLPSFTQQQQQHRLERNVNLASKSVLLKQEQPPVKTSPPKVKVNRVSNRYEVEHELNPFDYNNRDQFNNLAQPNRNFVFKLNSNTPPPTPSNPIQKTKQKPIINQSILEDEALARRLQEELLQEDLQFQEYDNMDFHDFVPPQNNIIHHNNGINQAIDPNVDDSYEALLKLADVPRPLNREILGKLPISNRIDRQECSICQSDINHGENAMSLPCDHIYHQHCVERWFKEHHTCPVCRHDLHP